VSDRLYFRLPPAPSVNTIYTVRRDGEITYTRWARKWKKEARNICYLQAYEQGWKPVRDWCRVVFIPYFPDRLTRDVTNLHKLVCDALTTVAYSDDYFALAHDARPGFDPEHPRLELLVYLDSEDLELAKGVGENADALRDFRETFAYNNLYQTPAAWATVKPATSGHGRRRTRPAKRR